MRTTTRIPTIPIPMSPPYLKDKNACFSRKLIQLSTAATPESVSLPDEGPDPGPEAIRSSPAGNDPTLERSCGSPISIATGVTASATNARTGELGIQLPILNCCIADGPAARSAWCSRCSGEGFSRSRSRSQSTVGSYAPRI